ncbi:hypothetical protein O181_113960 [Austropuccinia psidii MF-1]|uniref:Uncharacterized protein n=1 Tax=Austropuccinia psidii MF-1 TaxID=1389203 RepID=A0A9Q3K3J1_9BASI|nr:hypothetical protein [Austropuccinia psidii MF-1]
MTSPILYHLPLSNALFPQPSHLRLPPPPIITEEQIPKHPQNVTPRRSSQREYPHFNNDHSLEVLANNIPNSQSQVHPLTPTNEIIQEELDV